MKHILTTNSVIRYHQRKACQVICRPLFSSSACDPYTMRNIDQLEWVQRRASRVVNQNVSREASVTKMVRSLYLIPLQEGRARVNVIIVFKALTNIVDIPYNYLPRSTIIHLISSSPLIDMMPTSTLSTLVP